MEIKLLLASKNARQPRECCRVMAQKNLTVGLHDPFLVSNYFPVLFHVIEQLTRITNSFEFELYLAPETGSCELAFRLTATAHLTISMRGQQFSKEKLLSLELRYCFNG